MALKKPTENPARPAATRDYYGGADNTHEVGKCLEAWGAHRHTYLWTALVYLSRIDKKPGVEAVDDLNKAIRYIQEEINQREGRGWGQNA